MRVRLWDHAIPFLQKPTGKLDSDVVQCPWHGSRFNVHDGSAVDGPATFPQPRFETRVREGQIEVRALDR